MTILFVSDLVLEYNNEQMVVLEGIGHWDTLSLL